MSRAFVKESDGTEPEELTELPISDHRNLVTETGLNLIDERISFLKEKLDSKQVREDKPLTAQLSRDLRYWNARRSTAEIVPEHKDTTRILFGMKVTLEDDKGKTRSFRIVGQDEADPETGLLSYTSPLASSMIGRQKGDMVMIGDNEAEIIRIEN